ncbi:DNA replication/repair protein RecF [Kocuria sp. JC486]|uniref:DNA replication and repair protein RecF n=1 Tax=Kocuria soli TaxID=2485125 RepID=A0A3N3ZRZ0_9MICC|nr:DNA replication/repair protein RecF [Kocuria soli]NHU84912.1 DNA replication/repair protein RecF [Kocuria sp. JC486]ROZ64223.1 DNA replication/repair protein RecF [Kocuria soli]
MHLESLSLVDFRTYAALDLALGPGITVFLGSNGVGKTNIVEAVDFTATLGSHRVSSTAPLIRMGAERAVIRAGVRRAGHRTTLEFALENGKANTVRINRGSATRAREALGTVHTVLFSPEDLALIKGDPSNRRQFLDELATSMRPVLAGVRADYDKTVKQRNALLKSARAAGRVTDAHLATLSVWNEQLATSGAQLLHARLQLVKALEPEVHRAYAQLTDGPRFPSLRYRSSVLPAEAEGRVADLEHFSVADLRHLILEACERMQSKEVDRAMSLVGPHRDELELNLGDFPARGYASHGEMWSYALALRLGSWYVHLDDDRSEGASPILILDDVFAELDARRRDRLAEAVSGAEQVLVTAAVADDVPSALRDAQGNEAIRVIAVSPGRVETAEETARETAEGSDE